MPKTLTRKVFRSMWVHRKSYFACVFLIAIGVMMYVSMGIAADGLENAKKAFYEKYRLADVYASVGAIPVNEVDRLRNIDGVLDVSCRTKMEVRAEVAHSDKIITMCLISMNPEENERLNDIQIKGFAPTEPEDIVVNSAFMEAHDLQIGSAITLFVHGKAFEYTIGGSFLSPEYVYIVRDISDFLPDPKGFCIAYITEDSFENLTGRPNVANDLLFTLRNGYEFDDVKIDLEDALEPYGVLTLFSKDDQLSYKFLEMEITGVRTTATSLPFVFIAMAVIMLYLMMKRIIEQERTQIGTLKAFGYSDFDMVLHYLCYGGITGVVGGLLGWLFGFLMSDVFMLMYLEFFLLPKYTQPFNPMYVFLALVISITGGITGAFMGAMKVLHLNPAEAMRPESPKPIKGNIIGKIKALKYILNSRGIMALRGIARNPVRSGFIIISVTFSFALLTVSGSMNDVLDAIMLDQFKEVRLYDVRVSLRQPLGYTQAVEAAYAVPHVTQAEGLLELPVTLISRHLREGALLTGVPADSELFRVRDTNRRISFTPPADGLILSHSLANKLQARAGDVLYIESHLNSDDIPILVTRVIEQNLGSGAYMELKALSDLFDQPKAATAIIFNTDNLSFVHDYLKEGRNVTTIEDAGSTLQRYNDFLELYRGVLFINILMSIAVAFAIIYNTATIALSERKREYATLRVIGLSVEEVGEIMNFEYWLLGLLGMVLGIPMSMLIIRLVNSMVDTDLFSMPSTLQGAAYMTGVLGCAAAIILSNWSAKRRIRKFDMVEVLKDRE